MNKTTTLFMVLFAIWLSVSVVCALNVTTFEVHVLGPNQPVEQNIISIQVPDRIYLGEVSVGGQTADVKVDINNTGNVAISVTPMLATGHNEIFHNLYFKRILSESYYPVNGYTHNISAPSSNGVKTSYMYAKLDLRNYTGSFDAGSVNSIVSDVEFRAVAQ